MTQRRPDIGYIPTTPDLVEATLALANVTADDILYDLGCGDGRILIAAALKFGTRGVGIDIDSARLQTARHNAEQAGVSDRLQFRHADLFESDFSEATVVFLYLLPHLNLKLRPQLFRQLRPEVRVVSHDFDMGDWQPERVVQIQTQEDDVEVTATLYCWVMPPRYPVWSAAITPS